MNHALRMHDDLNPVERRVEEPMRLDDLKPFVHQCCRINRDLLPHRPIRVFEGVGARDMLQLRRRMFAKRPAGGCQENFLHICGAMALQRLKNRAVFAIDGQQAQTAPPHFRDNQCARDHERFFVG